MIKLAFQKFWQMQHTTARFSLLLIMVLVSNTLFAQRNDTLRRKDANGWEFIQVRDYNVVTTEGHLHNGIAEGVWNEYFPTTVPSKLTTYLHGIKDGEEITVNGAGMIVSVAHYKDGKLEGPKRVYNTENGMGLLEETYYSEGKKHGGYTMWYKNGRKQETGVYANDVRQGKSIWYFDNGAMAAEYNYRDGKIDGDVVTYYPNGKASASGQYKEDVQTGPWKEYYENGNLKTEGNYVDGEKDGIWKNYDENGNFTKNSKYVKGELK